MPIDAKSADVVAGQDQQPGKALHDQRPVHGPRPPLKAACECDPHRAGHQQVADDQHDEERVGRA